MHDSGKLQEIIEAKLGECVASSFSSIFSRYGDFGKQLEEILKTKLNIKPEDIALASYNDTVKKVLQIRLDQFINTQGEKPLNEMLDELLPTAPATITLTKLLENMVAENVEEAQRERWEQPALFIEESSSGFLHVSFDPKEKLRKGSECRYSFLIRREKDQPDDAPLEAFGVRVRDYFDNKIQHHFPHMYGDTEKTLFFLHARSTKLIMDIEPDEDAPYYPGYD